MRLAPVPMYFAADAAQAINLCADSSRTTHQAGEAVDACRYFGGLLVGALHGVDKGTRFSPLDTARSKATGTNIRWRTGSPKSPTGRSKRREPPEIKGGGYVVESLEAALWAFHKSRDFREGTLMAVNLGDDADTTGAIYGQIAGAYYGVNAIPANWRDLLTMNNEITSMADSLYDHARGSKGE